MVSCIDVGIWCLAAELYPILCWLRILDGTRRWDIESYHYLFWNYLHEISLLLFKKVSYRSSPSSSPTERKDVSSKKRTLESDFYLGVGRWCKWETAVVPGWNPEAHHTPHTPTSNIFFQQLLSVTGLQMILMKLLALTVPESFSNTEKCSFMKESPEN